MTRFPNLVTVALLIGLVLFSLYYPYTFFRHMWAFAFADPDRW